MLLLYTYMKFNIFPPTLPLISWSHYKPFNSSCEEILRCHIFLWYFLIQSLYGQVCKTEDFKTKSHSKRDLYLWKFCVFLRQEFWLYFPNSKQNGIKLPEHDIKISCSNCKLVGKLQGKLAHIHTEQNLSKWCLLRQISQYLT